MQPTEPVSRADLFRLRTAVANLAVAHRRRRFPPQLHLGVPPLPTISYDEWSPGALDHGLRVDVVSALVARSPAADQWLWLTRPGPPTWEDEDGAWWRAVRAVAAERARPMAFVVVTPTGWHAPATGATRVWKRIRAA